MKTKRDTKSQINVVQLLKLTEKTGFHSGFPRMRSYDMSSCCGCGIEHTALMRNLALAQKAGLLRSTLFWGITQRVVVVLYRRFGTTYQFHLQRSSNPRRKAYFLGFLPGLLGP
jgi:hypothetical protein